MRPIERPKKRLRINQDLLKEIKVIKLRIKSTKSRRAEGGVSDDKTPRRVMMREGERERERDKCILICCYLTKCFLITSQQKNIL